MKAFKVLLFLLAIALAMDAVAQSALPASAITEIKAAFPDCDIHSSSIGPLYAKNAKDVAASLYCRNDISPRDGSTSGSYALVVLAEGRNGEYRIAYRTRGLLLHFSTEIKKGSLFLHSGLSGVGGGKTAESCDYQFRFDGRNLVLIGATVDVDYIGEGKPTKEQEYRISINYVTGIVIDSREGMKERKLQQPQKITLQDFNFELGAY